MVKIFWGAVCRNEQFSQFSNGNDDVERCSGECVKDSGKQVEMHATNSVFCVKGLKLPNHRARTLLLVREHIHLQSLNLGKLKLHQLSKRVGWASVCNKEGLG